MMNSNNFGWSDAWSFLGVGLALGVALLAVGALSADHRVQSYYAAQSSDGNGNTPCVMAQRNWAPNQRVFCSDDISKIADAVKRLNAEMAHDSERSR